jgi:AcrR family transcriptional regulator
MPGKSADGASGATRAERTRERLLGAAEALLREGGLAAATVPAIAARAERAVGNVYKRFEDKEGLLEALFLRIVERASAENAQALDRARSRAEPIGPLLNRLLLPTARGYAQNRRLYAALIAFSEHESDPRFRKRLNRLRRSALRDASRILLDRRAQMEHPDPERGIEFILTAVASTLRGVLLSPRTPRRYRSDPERFGRELTRMVLGYLGLPPDSVADEEAGPADTPS